jgi:hypothetical protein
MKTCYDIFVAYLNDDTLSTSEIIDALAIDLCPNVLVEIKSKYLI